MIAKEKCDGLKGKTTMISSSKMDVVMGYKECFSSYWYGTKSGLFHLSSLSPLTLRSVKWPLVGDLGKVKDFSFKGLPKMFKMIMLDWNSPWIPNKVSSKDGDSWPGSTTSMRSIILGSLIFLL